VEICKESTLLFTPSTTFRTEKLRFLITAAPMKQLIDILQTSRVNIMKTTSLPKVMSNLLHNETSVNEKKNMLSITGSPLQETESLHVGRTICHCQPVC
jgi:hypothetical protein